MVSSCRRKKHDWIPSHATSAIYAAKQVCFHLSIAARIFKEPAHVEAQSCATSRRWHEPVYAGHAYLPLHRNHQTPYPDKHKLQPSFLYTCFLHKTIHYRMHLTTTTLPKNLLISKESIPAKQRQAKVRFLAPLQAVREKIMATKNILAFRLFTRLICLSLPHSRWADANGQVNLIFYQLITKK